MKNKRGQIETMAEPVVAPVAQTEPVVQEAPGKLKMWIWLVLGVAMLVIVSGVWILVASDDPDVALSPVVNDTVNESVDITPVVNESVDWNCTDSDGGKDYSVRGIVRDSEGGVADYCMDDRVIVFEYFCSEETGRGVEEYSCPNGCDEGVCV